MENPRQALEAFVGLGKHTVGKKTAGRCVLGSCRDACLGSDHWPGLLDPRPPMILIQLTITLAFTDKQPQVTPRRVPTSSRPVAPSATPSRLVAATRSDLLCTVCSAASLARLTVTPTRTPTSRRVLSGMSLLCSTTLRTPRSTFPAPRWPSVA